MIELDSTIIDLDVNHFLSSSSFLGIYLELFLISCISLLIIFFVIFDYRFKYKLILSINISYVFILIFILMGLLLNNDNHHYIIFNQSLVQDTFSIFIQNILIINFIFYIIISLNYIFLEKIINYEYLLLLGLSFLGMITMVKSNDLISLYLAIELQSLVFYIISSFKVYSNFSTEAGLKYFILGAFSSGILLLGCSLIYGFTGTTNFSDIYLMFYAQNLPNYVFNGFSLGIIFVTVSILFKIGAVPFHMWLPDVYEGVPTIVTALFAIVPKIALFGLLYRLGASFAVYDLFFWNEFLAYIGFFSIVIGTLGALYQVKIKRLLAYSAISHTGFLLIGYSTLDFFGIYVTLIYLIVYILLSLNIFTFLLSVRKWDNFLKLKKLNEFIILFRSNPFLAFNFCIILFSIGGIPPLLGFYSKFFIFYSAMSSHLFYIAIFAACCSVIASMYYIRLIKLMFFKRKKYQGFLFEVTKLNSILLSITLFFNVVFIFFPQKFLMILYNLVLLLY